MGVAVGVPLFAVIHPFLAQAFKHDAAGFRQILAGEPELFCGAGRIAVLPGKAGAQLVTLQLGVDVDQCRIFGGKYIPALTLADTFQPFATQAISQQAAGKSLQKQPYQVVAHALQLC